MNIHFSTRPFPPILFFHSYSIFILFPFSYLTRCNFSELSVVTQPVFQIFSIASYLAEERGVGAKVGLLSWLPWVFFLGWRSFQGGKDSPRTSELDPIFTFSTFCCHPIRWQGERWSCVAWNDSLATLPRLRIPRGNLDPNRRTRIHDYDPSFEFFLFIEFYIFFPFHPSVVLRGLLENSFESEGRGSTIMIHLSIFFHIFFSFSSKCHHLGMVGKYFWILSRGGEIFL